jgi:2-oxoglutarate decarboxylase
VRRLYTERLAKRGDLTAEQAEEALRDFQARLEAAFAEAKEAKQPEPPLAIAPVERGVLPPGRHRGRACAARPGRRRPLRRPRRVPSHPKLDRILVRAHERYREGEVDWALGEALAFGTLLAEGTWVRLAGQDSRAARSRTATPSRSTTSPARTTSRSRTSATARASSSSTTRR